MDTDHFNYEELNDVEDRYKYQIKTSNRFEAFEDLYYSRDINRTQENIRISKSKLKCSAV